VREPTTATVNATTTENAREPRVETARGRVLRPLVARVDVRNAMAILLKIGEEVDGSTGGREKTGTRNMNIGRESRGMEKERMLLTDNTRRNSGLGHQQMRVTKGN